MSKFSASKFLELKPGERVTFGTALAYTENWCDGNGNLGPCMCADDEKVGRGHWRGGRRIEIVVDELLQRVAEAQREACALRADFGYSTPEQIRATPLVTEGEP